MPTQEEERKHYLDLIISSNKPRKIIVAGPGTGKTYTFRKLLENIDGDKIVITFINNLARSLENDLQGIAQVYTFHKYCKKVLHKLPVGGITTHFEFFPYLPDIIEKDGNILNLPHPDIKEAIQNLKENDDRIDFYINRANYYDAVSFDDSVYRVLKYYLSHPGDIPVFAQIIVDEYQDFNRLEVEFINILESRSPILIAGDDDQAVYEFKNASPAYIRAKSNDPNYERFELPLCSRCPQVIVDAVADIIQAAQNNNTLKGRVPKNFQCYLPDKRKDSIAYPFIQHAQCSVYRKNAPYISRYIDNEISLIPQDVIAEMTQKTKETSDPGILIIGPSHYLKMIYKDLSAKYVNISYKGKGNELSIVDGYRVLSKNNDSNLGWRIILELSNISNKNDLILRAGSNTPLKDLLEIPIKISHLEAAHLIEKMHGEELSDTEIKKLEEISGIKYAEILSKINVADTPIDGQQGKNEIGVKLTTFNGAKGLSASYVFIVGFNNGDFPINPSIPTDNEICQFIVALTRTRKKCYLISNSSFAQNRSLRSSEFLRWIDPMRIRNLNVNRQYFS